LKASFPSVAAQVQLPGGVFPKPIQPQNQTNFAACDWSPHRLN